MSIVLEYWKQKLNVPLAFSLFFIVVIAIGMYGFMLIQSYAAYALYNSARYDIARFMHGQSSIDQAGRVAGIKKNMGILEVSLARDPGRAETYFALGELLSACADDPALASLIWPNDAGEKDALMTQAISYYLQALERFPTNPIYQQRLGLLYSKIGLIEKAQVIFSNAELLDPHNATLRLFLAQYYWEKDDPVAFDKQAAMVVRIYSQALKGGGRLVDRKSRVEEFFRSIGKEEMLTE